MRWEDLTTSSFEEAVELCGGVCVLPIGVLEAHGPHLPVGTDATIAHRLACTAAEMEPALVFPSYPWGLNVEAKAWPGSIVLGSQLVLDLLTDVCTEISRNGCKKIILFSGHGGNRFLLSFFVQSQLDQGVDYIPYLVIGDGLGRDDFFYTLFADGASGHAGECETSLMMYLAPQCTHPEWIPERPAIRSQRLDHLTEDLYTPIDWYGRYADHYKGDARSASAEKGKAWFAHRAARLALIISAVKDDRAAPEVYREYVERTYRR